jgi:hypothetical protein
LAIYPQLEAKKGSQKWIQKIVNENRDILNRQLRIKLDISEDEVIEWLSPLRKYEYAEYRDKAVLDLLGISIDTVARNTFWPERGPQWDGIGRTSKDVFLVEAKSHIPELISSLQAKDPTSIKTINSSLEKTKKELCSKTDFDWSKTFYQYANRLAHVNFLRRFNIPTYFVCVYFVNDLEMKGPTTVDEWKGAIRVLHECLGLREYLLQKWVVDVFVDVSNLQKL